MNFSSLSSNEKLAVYGSIAVIVGGLVGFYGVGLLAVLAAIAMLAIVFLPQMSPSTNLPGSKGSLMLLAGGVAAVVLVLSLLVYAGVLFAFAGVGSILFLVAVVGGLVMGWAGWQEFQAEGGKFQLGSGPAASSPPPSSPPPSTPPPAAPAGPATDVPDAPPPAAAPPPSGADMTDADSDEDDRPRV
ncbi:MAG TPA: hypothetical protein VFM19_04680 [Candidatus Limnocylindria bacterium]|nr:hypothetical protein [Candidatus Limnocylindria bacterium]